ncbi:MAG: aminotransferase class I/II-fold pyridoxal phosphate-dependent enzyme, partial [Desulfobacterales bacterium]|nr:aminotransferase class I/II-fold pyridoxal phosphate-dependent enzyme [Desulfobacterales bacterium]
MKLAQRMDLIPFSGIRKVFEKVGQLEAAGKKIIHLEIGRPDFTTPENIVNACHSALDDGQVHYTSNYGIPGLRKAVAEKFRQDNGLEYDFRNEIIVTAGANEAVFATIMSLLDPGDEILIPSPCWPTYFSCAHMAGAVPVAVKAGDDFQLDISSLEKALTPKTKMLVVNTPHNPTGTVYTRETLEKVAEC